MEKISFKNSRNLNLAGNFSKADSDKIIILCHGFTGDKSEWGRFTEAGKALSREGFNVLAFDFSGCGESDDEALNSESFVDDLNCAIKWAKAKEMNRIGLLGLSLGGNIACRVNAPEIITRVLWAPVTKASNALEHQEKKDLKLLDENTYLRTRQSGVRKEIKISKQIFDYFTQVGQKELLLKVKTPVLILHGDKDDNIPIEYSINAMHYLPDGSQLKIIKGADHEFADMVERFVVPTVFWFKEKM